MTPNWMTLGAALLASSIPSLDSNAQTPEGLLQKLLDWAIPANAWNFPAKTLIVCIYPDDPQSTPPEQQRLWLGITLSDDATPPESIRTLTLPAGLHAIGRFAVTSDQFGPAWGYMYGEWMAQSGHVPAGLAFELQKNDSSEDPGQKHIIDICIPVQKIPAP